MHPAACRTAVGKPIPSANSGRTPLCGYRVDLITPQPAPARLLVLQKHFDALLAGTDATPSSLGVPVSAAQYMRDIRLVSVLLQLAEDRSQVPDLSQTFNDALAAHADYREAYKTRRAAQPPNVRRTTSDHIWSRPVDDLLTHAALMTKSVNILEIADLRKARAVLTPLVDAAAANEPQIWNKVRPPARPSDVLFRFLSPKRAGVFSTHVLRPNLPTRITLTADHVPALLPLDMYNRWFADFPASAAQCIRRLVPLAIVQGAHNATLKEAADILGVPRGSAQAASTQSGRACRPNDRDDEFRAKIGLAAAQFDRDRINYGARRAFIHASWDFTAADWADLLAALPTNMPNGDPTPWNERRLALRVAVWTITTSGSHPFCPMLPENRLSTAARLQDPDPTGYGERGRLRKNTMISYRRFSETSKSPMRKIVVDYSRTLAIKIDAARNNR